MNQNQRALCSIQINSFMSAAVSSEVCIRRTRAITSLNTRFCDPLHGKNVFATLFPREIVPVDELMAKDDEKFILITARMDTTSMFDGLAPGAKGSIASFGVIVATAHLLASLTQMETKNVIFMLFNGETYDYIGSQRFVYDLKKGLFPHKVSHTNPINLTSIEMMIDLGTLDDLTSIQAYRTSDDGLDKDVLASLIRLNGAFNFNITFNGVKSDNYPPTSAQSFLRENVTFPILILTSKPTNPFYHSIYDTPENLGFTYKNTSLDFTEFDDSTVENTNFDHDSVQIGMRNISTLLAYTLYELISNKKMTEYKKAASSVLIDEFLYCYLASADCPLFKASTRPDGLPGSPYPSIGYVSVQGSLTQEMTGWTYRILGFLIGQKQNDVQEKSNCSMLPLFWFSGVHGTGECRLTTQNFSQAYSPAFFEDGYDWKSGRYSTWTESTWRELSARIFLRPARSHEVLTLSIGVVVLVISFLLVFLINSKSDILFGNTTSSSSSVT